MLDLSNIKLFKVHPSSANEIVAGNIGITEKQNQTILELQAKKEGVKGITEKQHEELTRLIGKRDNPVLPAGAKTHCQIWLKEQTQLYGVKKHFTSKYTAKGNMVEEQSFGIIAKHLGLDKVTKNDEFFSNDWIEGTPDALPPALIIDAKNSWDPFSFPLFQPKLPDQKYFWQAQAYMDIVPGNIQLAKFIYTLVDTPEELIRKEARNWCFENGYELNPDITDEFRARMTYGHIADELKIRVFDIERDDLAIMKIRERVEMCRKYIASLVEDIKAGRPIEVIEEEKE